MNAGKKHAILQLVADAYPRGCPKKLWLENINNDMKSLKTNAELSLHQNKWRKATQKKTYSVNTFNTH